ncbi:DUF1566 domain-containing protein [Ralstonia insidiosa]|uniref:DUF1566 domain-containing protein n=1 Tax=Ralstonia insidiosa TaxID=190721 RepID=A0A848NXK7_9RALS|nr:DUF1566 domain-containing protein [Ralstonia insidiosa]NMV37206.1 DUF1566 domain-containing protein [Ralstonia insidiosa]
MTITLEAIKAEHTKIGEMIAIFEKQAPTEHHIAAATIPLAAGERFAGPILNDDGTLSHYVILLPGEAEEVNWADACKWAEEKGGVLPDRSEQSLLYTNLKAEFQEAWYWSGQAHERESGWAWFQHFGDGTQTCDDRHDELRARAVRRFIPSVI